jgi:L-alanine-DL-glutamate epimerase-like enolase superfamily enzyme
MIPGRRGLAKTPTGPGLGVTVQEDVLERLGQVHKTFEAEAVKTG